MDGCSLLALDSTDDHRDIPWMEKELARDSFDALDDERGSDEAVVHENATACVCLKGAEDSAGALEEALISLQKA